MQHLSLKDSHLFSKAYLKGEKYRGRYICVYVMKDRMAGKLKAENPEKKKLNRFGVSTSKKLGNAVMRSRLRRIVRAAYAEVEKKGILQGYIIVITPRMAATQTGVRSQDIARELSYALGRMNMLPPANNDT